MTDEAGTCVSTHLLIGRAEPIPLINSVLLYLQNSPMRQGSLFHFFFFPEKARENSAAPESLPNWPAARPHFRSLVQSSPVPVPPLDSEAVEEERQGC